MSWANMRQDATRRAIPRSMCPGSLKKCVLKSGAVASYGLTGDRRNRYKCLDFRASVCETSRHADSGARKSDEIDAEIVRVLTEKFSWEQHRAMSALQAILARAIRVKIRGTVKECRDPGDDMFLECAALAKADLLVAGDKDLLTLGTYKGTRIVTPSEYLRAQ